MSEEINCFILLGYLAIYDLLFREVPTVTLLLSEFLLLITIILNPNPQAYILIPSLLFVYEIAKFKEKSPVISSDFILLLYVLATFDNPIRLLKAFLIATPIFLLLVYADKKFTENLRKISHVWENSPLKEMFEKITKKEGIPLFTFSFLLYLLKAFV